MKPTKKRIALLSVIFIATMFYVAYQSSQIVEAAHTAEIQKEYAAQNIVEEDTYDDVYIAEQEITELPPVLQSLGLYELTGYCACMQCCGKTNGITATGEHVQANHTIAVDPTDIPYGTHVIINGQEYVASDCGGAIKGKRIDIYFETHQEALNFGRQKNVEVFEVICEGGKI